MRRQSDYQFPLTRYPAVRITVLFSVGILLSAWISIKLLIWIGAFILSISLWMLSERACRKSFHPGAHNLCLSFYIISTILSGGLWVSLHTIHTDNERNRLDYLNLYVHDQIVLSGKVINRYVTPSGRVSIDVEVDRLQLDGRNRRESCKIRVYSSQLSDNVNEVYEGSTITAIVQLAELNPPANPHEFDYKRYLETKGIYFHGELVTVIEIDEPEKNLTWYTLRNKFREKIDDQFEGDSASLAQALLMGHRQEMSRDDQQLFARSGLSHIMAVSGLHVGFLVAPFWIIIPWFTQWRTGKIIGILLLTFILLGYAGITGFSPSVLRASLMIWLLTAGKLIHKNRDSLNLMGVSAYILLLLNPDSLFDIGFQLSYSAVIVILVVLPSIRKAISTACRFESIRNMILIVVVSVVVQFGLYPLLVFYFGEFSLIAPIANVLVVPLLFIFIPYTMFIIPVVDLLPSIIPWATMPMLYLEWVWLVVETIGSWNGSWIESEITTPWIFVGWFFVLGLIASISVPELRWKYVIGLLVVMVLCQTNTLINKLSPATMEVTVLDVGQGDAVYIKTPNNKKIMIDTGKWTPYGNSGEQVLLPFLDEKKVTELDAVILTHPHADHIGGILSLIEHIKIDTIYYNGYDYDSDLYNEYRQLAREFEITEIKVQRGDVIRIDPSLRFFVLGPAPNLDQENPNDQSIVLKVFYNKTRWVFSGDAEKNQEKRINHAYGDFLESDYLKIGHHGSRTSSGSDFIASISPKIAVGSLALNNRFSHPHPETIHTYHQYNTQLYFTSLDGAIVFESDGTKINRKDWR